MGARYFFPAEMRRRRPVTGYPATAGTLTPGPGRALLRAEPQAQPKTETKTMATFQRAEDATLEMVAKVIRECYPDLQELVEPGQRFPLSIDVLDVWADRDANGEPKGHPLKAQGRTAAATIQVVSKADRALGQGDVLIKIDRDYWDKLNEEQQEALIDHELHHLVVKKEDGLPKRDDLGRFMFGMRHHDYDFGWFVEVAKRRGLASPEVQQAKRIMAENGQWLFAFADQPGLKLHVVEREEAPAPKPPAHEPDPVLEQAMQEAGPAKPGRGRGGRGRTTEKAASAK